MRKNKLFAYTAMATAIGFAAAACGSSSGSTSGGGGGGGSSAGFGAALTSVVNQSSATGGSVVYDDAATLDSADGRNTYEASNWDFLRLYDRTMLSYNPEPGSPGLTPVPDLATGLGKHNANDTVWTYTIQPNATYKNGSPITTADIKYAIESSNWGHAILKSGPTYFSALVQDNTKYQGPYVDKNPADGVSGIQTPNSTTIVFTLNQPFADFDYLMTLPQTAPVPRSADTGATYQQNMVTSGQYEVASYSIGKQMVLVPNPKFVTASDPSHLHKVIPAKITVNYGVNQDTIDQNLLHGDAQMDIGGTGLDSAAQGQVLGNPTYKGNADSVPNGFQSYLSINTKLPTFQNVDCRQAVEWAVNKQAIVTAAGGNIGGGTVASSILPTNNIGYVQDDMYATPGNQGDATKAEALVASCKAALGSKYNPSFAIATYDASDSPKSPKLADVVQANLNAIGFKVSVNQYPFSTFNSTSAPGSPTTAVAANIGMSLTTWGADFPTGYGYMEDILTSAGISDSGSYNTSYWSDPTFDADLAKALSASTPADSKAAYAAADKYALSQGVIVPLINTTSLLYRPTGTTNVTVDSAYGMYDYTLLGTTSK